MKCKKCNAVILAGASFCSKCGTKVYYKNQLKVPTPRLLPSGKYNIQLRAEGVSITEPTAEQCIAKAIAIRANVIETRTAEKAKQITFSEAIDNYIAARDSILSPSTIRGYRIIQRNRFKDTLGKKITTPVDWQAVINAEKKLGIKTKTLQNSWRLISSVLRAQGLPVPVVTLPTREKYESSFLEPEEIKPYIAQIEGSKIEIAALLALHSLRQSEILAIDWDEIDLVNGTIHVCKSMVPDEHNIMVDRHKNKNYSSTRTIPIFIPRLKEILLTIPKESRNGKLVTISDSTILRELKDIRPDITLHKLRHTFASLCYSMRIPELECMNIGGWSSYDTMRKIYTHLANKDRLKAENKLTVFFADGDKDK